MVRFKDAVLFIGGRRRGRASGVIHDDRPAAPALPIDIDRPGLFEFKVDDPVSFAERVLGLKVLPYQAHLMHAAARKRSIDKMFGAGSELARTAYAVLMTKAERVILDQVSRTQAQAMEAVRLAEGMERRAEVIRGRDFAHRGKRLPAIVMATPERHRELVAELDNRIASANAQLRQGARTNPKTLKAEPLIRGGRSARRAAARDARRLSRRAVAALRDAGMEPPAELLRTAFPPIKFSPVTAQVPERKPVSRAREEARRRAQAEHRAFNVVREECELELRVFFGEPAAAAVAKRHDAPQVKLNTLRRLGLGRAATCTDAEVAAWARFTGWISTPRGQDLLGRFVEPLDAAMPPAGAKLNVVAPSGGAAAVA